MVKPPTMLPGASMSTGPARAIPPEIPGVPPGPPCGNDTNVHRRSGATAPTRGPARGRRRCDDMDRVDPLQCPPPGGGDAHGGILAARDLEEPRALERPDEVARVVLALPAEGAALDERVEAAVLV